MVEADRGQLPGQLYTPQPYFLPLRISAPPRVGKSAAALLMATLAKRAGMKTVYSVSPYKDTPIQEMQTKMIRIGWRDPGEAAAADKAVREQFVDEVDYKENTECLQMKYSHFVIDNVPGKSKAAPDATKIDMILYSSDVPDDCQRIGAVLADWKYRDVIVFHLRDEAQSLAKALKNMVAGDAHRRDVPPPVELQYLRYYYGNGYGLNCNVTATHFPTLLEEKMWGYIGSVRQNASAGLPLSAGVGKISAQLGANFLPTLVPALLPVVSEGYIGVGALTTWSPKGVPRTLEMGASHSGVDFNTGELRRAVAALPANTTNKKKAAEAVPRLTRAQRAERGRKVKEGGLDKDEAAEVLTEAIRDANKSVEEILRESDPDYVAGLDEEDDPDEVDESTGAKRKGQTKEDKKEKARKLEEKVANDIDSVQDHFNEWLALPDAQEQDVNYPSWWLAQEPRSPVKTKEGRPINLVPMHIGALNNEVSDSGMASFVRTFGVLAHQNAKKNSGTAPPRPGSKFEAAKAQRRRTHGVVFVLFTSTLKTREHVIRSKIKMVDAPDPVKDPNEKQKQGPSIIRVGENDAKSSAGPPPACEPASARKKYSALCCIYDPQHPLHTDLPSGSEPFFEVTLVPAAEDAVKYAFEKYNISKISILGFNMLKAGLTVQTVIDQRTDDEEKKPVGPLRIYCPKYVALATAENAALDAQLQIAGRSFVELKGMPAPTNWKIQFLGVQGRVEALQRYSEMEERLARISGKRVYEALKEGFGARMMVANSLGTLGVVGTQRGDFGSILGLTPADARRRANAAKKVRESVAPGGTLSENDQKALLEQAEEAAAAEAAAKADLARAAAVPADDEMDVEN